MSVMVMTCPHCAAERMTFDVVGVISLGKGKSAAVGKCVKCGEPVLTQLFSTIYSPDKLLNAQVDLLEVREAAVLHIWPQPPAIDAPLHLPDKVLRAFMDAANARRVQLWNPACGAYRRCMELALKAFAPDVDAWKIEKRIDKLAAEHRITPDLKAWAHELRLDGNEAVHGDEDATQEITDQMHHLTYFLLTYLYTLPQQVEEARARRREGAAE